MKNGACLARPALAAALLAAAFCPGESAVSGEGDGRGGAAADPYSFYPEATEEQRTAILAAIEGLSSDDWALRCRSTGALVEIQDAAIPFMARALEASSDPEVRFRLRFALHSLDWAPESTLRWLADEGLAILAERPRTSAELEEAGGNIELLRRRTMERLVAQGRRALPAIAAVLKSSEYIRRRKAVEVLAEIGLRHGDKRVIPILIGALKDVSRDSYVESGAADGLRRITGQVFKSYQVREWKEWWAAKGGDFAIPRSGD